MTLEADAATARISVTDAGGGDIAPETLEELKRPFVWGANAGAAKGAGLGLAIAATIARQHGGTLEFERSGEGIRAILSIARG